jgi:hypothetical protein
MLFVDGVKIRDSGIEPSSSSMAFEVRTFTSTF